MTVVVRTSRSMAPESPGAGAPKREAAMRRLVQVLLIALLVFLVIALAVGCSANRQALRPEGPKVEVRLPPAEAVDIRLRHETAPQPRPSPPYSVTDESEGRWLTLFEINVTPSEAAGVPSAPAESP